MKCEFLDGCAFFQEFRDELGSAYYGFISLYCDSDKRDECKRRQYRLEHGEPPPKDMLPNGVRYHPKH